LNDRAADIVSNNADAIEVESVEKGENVSRLVVCAKSAGWFVAIAEAPQVRCDQPIAIGQARHHRLPGQPELRPTMQQQQRASCADFDDMQRRAIHFLE